MHYFFIFFFTTISQMVYTMDAQIAPTYEEQHVDSFSEFPQSSFVKGLLFGPWWAHRNQGHTELRYWSELDQNIVPNMFNNIAFHICPLDVLAAQSALCTPCSQLLHAQNHFCKEQRHRKHVFENQNKKPQKRKIKFCHFHHCRNQAKYAGGFCRRHRNNDKRIMNANIKNHSNDSVL